MKILLLHPEIRTNEPCAHAPYGLLQLAALTDQLGFKVAVLDNNAFRLPLDSIRQTIKEETAGWDVIGISALTTQYQFVKKILPICREECPSALIVGGGGLFTAQPFDMMRWLPELDVAAIGEAYLTWPEILEHIEDRGFKNVKGLVYRDGKKVKLSSMRPLIEEYYYCENHKTKRHTFEEAANAGFKCKSCNAPLMNNLDEQIPWPAYEFSPVETYLMNSRIPYSIEAMNPNCRRLDILASLGCPFKCVFCFHLGASPSCQSKIYGKTVTGKEYRQHSPKYITRLITHLRLVYGINFVSFIDENFTVNRRWFFEFCREFEEAGLATLVHWGILAHTRTVDKELLEKGKDVGLSYVSYGGETFSEHLLKDIHKGQTKEQMVAAIEATQAAQINPIMTFIVGFAGETIDDVIETCQGFIDNQIHTVPFFLQAYPGTELFDKYKDKIIEQHMTEAERAYMIDGKLTVALMKEVYGESYIPKEISSNQQRKLFPELQGKIRDKALERWVLSLDDATKLSSNLTDFSDVELAGLQYMLATWELERLKKFKKTLEDRKK